MPSDRGAAAQRDAGLRRVSRLTRWLLAGAVVLATDRTRLGPACLAVAAEVAEIDRACSRFREDSELTMVNDAGGRSVVVGDVLFEALEVALRAARLTDGDVDPTVGQAI